MSGLLPLVGRRAESDKIGRFLAPDSGGRVLLISGEAGVGKSRLVSAATGESPRVVIGSACLSLTESVPLLPLAELLRAAARSGGEAWLAGALEDSSPAVVEGLTGLVPDLLPVSSAAAAGARDGLGGAWWRQRLFAGVRELLNALDAAQPVVFVVEDVHWADSFTLDFLALLASGGTALFDARLVLTYRTGDPDASSAAEGWRARLVGMPSVQRVQLGPLSERDTGVQLAGLLGRAASADEVGTVFARSGGVPLFTELVASAGGQVPEGLREIFASRLRDLEPDARRVADVLAVAGRALPIGPIAAATGSDGLSVRAGLRELRDARLLDPDTTDGYRLRHALFEHAGRAELLVEERAELHARLAELLQGWGAAPAEVADHLQGAGQPREELVWRLRAAEAAGSAGAAGEAAPHWLRAVELCRGLPDAEQVTGRPVHTVFIDAAETAKTAVMRQTAYDLAAEAANRFPHLTGLHQGRLKMIQARAAATVDGDGDRALTLALGGIRALEGEPAGPTVIRHMLRLWTVAIGSRHFEVADDVGRRVQAKAAGIDDYDRAIQSYWGSTHLAMGRPQEAYEAILAARAAVSSMPLDREIEAAVFSTDVLLKLGRLEEISPHYSYLIDTVAQLGVEDLADSDILRDNIAESLLALGRVEEARAYVREEPLAPDALNVYGGYAAMLDGDLDRAERIFAAHSIGMHPRFSWGIEVHGRWAELDLWQGNPDTAARRGFDIFHAIADTALTQRYGWVLALTVRAMADRADADPTLNREELADQLRALRESCAHDPLEQTIPATSAPAQMTWDAELTRLTGASDPQVWSAAAASWGALSFRFWHAYCLWRHAEALLDHRDRVAATPVLSDAHDRARGHRPLTAAIEQTATHARILLTTADRPPQPTRTFGLTDRELDVLRELVDGKTNSQIGADLYISPKTASVHVTNILRKLGVTSRSAAASTAQRAGLLDAWT